MALYTVLSVLLLPLLFLFFVWRFGMKKTLAGLRERSGMDIPSSGDAVGGSSVWFHASSVGEVKAVQPLIAAFRQRNPGVRVLLTTTTLNGKNLAERTRTADEVRLAPLDFKCCVRRLIARWKPKMVVLVETEIWPQWITAFFESAVPVMVVNGRLSDKAFRAYALLGGFWRGVFSRLSMVGAQSVRNADRFRSLGVPTERVRVVGNLKYDVQPKRAADVAARRRKYGFKPDDFIWVCGSTHEGEEEILLKAFIGIRRKGDPIKLILAPRDIDRAGGLLAAVKDHGPFRGERRSLLSSDPDELDVLVLDVMGELGELYQLGQVAFVGGSLIRHGGQNPLEPARYGVPVIFGPSMENFSEMVESFLEERGAVVVRDSQELLAILKLYRGDEAERVRAGSAAARVAGLQSGAVERTLAVIEELLRS